MTRFITITSGKGGVGKTNLSVNLAIQLSNMGKRTCLFDADLGLANINILLGLNPEKTLMDVITGTATMEDIIIAQNDRFDILPGSSGVEEMANLDQVRMQSLITSFQNMVPYDFFLFDTSAGISREVLSFCMAASEVLMVIVPEPTSLTDSYALIKQLKLNNYQGLIKIVVNRCKTEAHAKLVYEKISAVVEKHLNIPLVSLGMISNDEKVSQAISKQKPLLSMYPQASAAKNIIQLAERLFSQNLTPCDEDPDRTFWKKCFSFLKPSRHDTAKNKIENKTVMDQKVLSQIPINRASHTDREEDKTDSKIPVETVNEDSIASPAVDVQNAFDAILLTTAEKLNRTMSQITEELKNIRNAIEDMENPPRGQGIQEQSANTADVSKRIKLDFHSFLKNRISERGKDFHDNHTN